MSNVKEIRHYQHKAIREVSVQRTRDPDALPQKPTVTYVMSLGGLFEGEELNEDEARALRDCLSAALGDEQEQRDLEERTDRVSRILMNLSDESRTHFYVDQMMGIKKCINILQGHD